MPDYKVATGRARAELSAALARMRSAEREAAQLDTGGITLISVGAGFRMAGPLGAIGAAAYTFGSKKYYAAQAQLKAVQAEGDFIEAKANLRAALTAAAQAGQPDEDTIIVIVPPMWQRDP